MSHVFHVKQPYAEAARSIIGRFLDAVWMERGLSTNTLAAYRADLVALSRWLALRNIVLSRCGRGDLLAFIDRADAERFRE